MIKANFHTHSTFCDGASTPEEMVKKAIELGFSALGFSGHVDIDPVMNIINYIHEIRCLQERYKNQIEILCGGEIDTFYPDPYGHDFDYKIGSNHYLDVGENKPISIDCSKEDYLWLLDSYFDKDIYKLCRAYYEREARVYDWTHCDIIAHFDLVTKYNNCLNIIDEENPKYLRPAMEALDYLLSENVIFEINTRMIDYGKIYPHKKMLQRIRELKGEIIISSDAHNIQELNKGFEKAVELAKSIGFDHVNYLCMKNGKKEYLQVGI